MTYVSITGSPQAIDHKVIAASKELGGEFAYRKDMNSGDSLGIGKKWRLFAVGRLTPSVLRRMGSVDSRSWRKKQHRDGLFRRKVHSS